MDSVDVSFSVKSADNSGTENADSTNAVVNRLLPRYIRERLEEAVNAALMKPPLLPDWEHGGFGNPDCTGTRKNGPAMMLQFNYNTGDGGKLKLTLDLVLAIDLREILRWRLVRIVYCRHGTTVATRASEKETIVG